MSKTELEESKWFLKSEVQFKMATNLVKQTSQLASLRSVLECGPKRIVLSGPSGFLGSHVLDSILDVHEVRKANNVHPGEVILLSSSPGKMMKRLHSKYGEAKMSTIRASRVDYFSQHDSNVWRDHLGSLGKKEIQFNQI